MNLGEAGQPFAAGGKYVREIEREIERNGPQLTACRSRGATKTFPAEAGISRYGKPEEIADLMAFLVSPSAKWLIGTSVRMDGGEVKGI